jgi:hypothetical protein
MGPNPPPEIRRDDFLPENKGNSRFIQFYRQLGIMMVAKPIFFGIVSSRG